MKVKNFAPSNTGDKNNLPHSPFRGVDAQKSLDTKKDLSFLKNSVGRMPSNQRTISMADFFKIK